jgi:hypothetical protein
MVAGERSSYEGTTMRSRADDISIWRTAEFVLKRYGDDAGGFAAGRAERLLRLGDKAGNAAWTKILRAILDLQRQSPARGEPVN